MIVLSLVCEMLHKVCTLLYVCICLSMCVLHQFAIHLNIVYVTDMCYILWLIIEHSSRCILDLFKHNLNNQIYIRWLPLPPSPFIVHPIQSHTQWSPLKSRRYNAMNDNSVSEIVSDYSRSICLPLYYY